MFDPGSAEKQNELRSMIEEATSITAGIRAWMLLSKEGLPIGFQFIGPRLSEDLMYQVAYAFEQSTDYHLKTPKGFE